MHVFLTAHRCAVRPGSGVCGQNAAGVLPADSTSRERLTLSPREEWMVAVEKCASSFSLQHIVQRSSAGRACEREEVCAVANAQSAFATAHTSKASATGV